MWGGEQKSSQYKSLLHIPIIDASFASGCLPVPFPSLESLPLVVDAVPFPRFMNRAKAVRWVSEQCNFFDGLKL